MAYAEESDNLNGFVNEIVTAVLKDAITHYNKVINSLLNISSPLFVGNPRLDFSIKDNEIYIDLIDSENIKQDVCSLFGKEYNGKIFERDIRNAIANVRNIKTPDELEKRYPRIYFSIYKGLINSKIEERNSEFQIIEKYRSDFEYFITDICDAYESVINNLNRIDIALKNNKFIVSKDYAPNAYYNILFEVVALAALNAQGKASAPAPDISIFDSNIMKMYNELKGYDKDLVIYNNHTKRKITLDEVKEYYNKVVFKPICSHEKDLSIPLFADDKIISKIYNCDCMVRDDMEYTILKYSGLFEFGYNRYDVDSVVIGLKNEYDNKTIYELYEMAINNLRKLKPSDIYLAQTEYMKNQFVNAGVSYEKTANVGVTADDVIRVINSDKSDDKLRIYNRLKYLLTTEIKVSSDDLVSSDERIKRDFILMFCYNAFTKPDIYDLDELIALYIDYLNNEAKENKFIKFAEKISNNKAYLSDEDFVKASSNVKQYLIEKIGKEKLNEILEKTKNVAHEDAKTIIEEYLIAKKSVSDEIDEIKRQIRKLTPEDINYRALNQRLEKLEFYKDNFESEEVINGEGPIFKDYYGFEFDGFYVFDCFIDSDEETASEKAKEEYGHKVYILDLEDYLKVNDISNRRVLSSYISSNIKPCGNSMNHGGDFKGRFYKKTNGVREAIKKRNYVMEVAKTDNPVTDEEIIITQTEFEYYARKYLTDNNDEINALVKKSRKFMTKADIEREKSVELVEKKNAEEPPQTGLTTEDLIEFNKEIEELGVTLEKVNEAREEKGLSPLSLENDNYYDVCRAIYEYKDEKKDETEKDHSKKIKRNAMIAKLTKERTFENDLYHCECCGDTSIYLTDFESHHFIPISEGGPDAIYNTVCLCTRCHSRIHNVGLSDYQNYMLIETIREYITTHAPEALPKFEQILGRKENKYMEAIAEIDETAKKIKNDAEKKQLDLIELGKVNGMSEEEIDAKIDEVDNSLAEELKQLDEARNKNLFIANRLQDYYRYSEEYNNIEAKTLDSNKTR